MRTVVGLMAILVFLAAAWPGATPAVQAKGGYYDVVIGGGDLGPSFFAASAYAASPAYETMPCGLFTDEPCPDEAPILELVEAPADGQRLLSDAYDLYFDLAQMSRALPAKYVASQPGRPAYLYLPFGLTLFAFSTPPDTWIEVPGTTSKYIETAVGRMARAEGYADPTAALVYEGIDFEQLQDALIAGDSGVIERGILRDGKTVWIPVEPTFAISYDGPGAGNDGEVALSADDAAELVDAFVATLHNSRPADCPDCSVAAVELLEAFTERGHRIRSNGWIVFDYLAALGTEPAVMRAHISVPIQGGFALYEADPALDEAIRLIIAAAAAARETPAAILETERPADASSPAPAEARETVDGTDWKRWVMAAAILSCAALAVVVVFTAGKLKN